ncbi:hypothetical protein C1C17_00785 [Salmonella enterica subsp. houtenae serovar 40:z4,z24:-]|nr:hypothetical protein [Salmonella enterica subsp. houtenae serovar 40:z4,z24:-]
MRYVAFNSEGDYFICFISNGYVFYVLMWLTTVQSHAFILKKFVRCVFYPILWLKIRFFLSFYFFFYYF